uniref:Uncharacterized protein n=1 Tax=Schistosoma haematobium TaxID=6185 RepID=A0A095B0R2_SCHHA
MSVVSYFSADVTIVLVPAHTASVGEIRHRAAALLYAALRQGDEGKSVLRLTFDRSPSDFRDTRRHSPPGYERNRSGHEYRYLTRSQSSSKRSSRHKTSRPRSRTPSRQSSHRNSNRHSRSQSRNSHKNNGRHSPTPDRRSVSDYDRSHSRSPDVERRHSYEDSGSPVDEGRNASPVDRGARNHNSRSVSRSRSRSQQSNHRFRSRSPSDYHNDGAPREHSSDSRTGKILRQLILSLVKFELFSLSFIVDLIT